MTQRLVPLSYERGGAEPHAPAGLGLRIQHHRYSLEQLRTLTVGRIGGVHQQAGPPCRFRQTLLHCLSKGLVLGVIDQSPPEVEGLELSLIHISEPTRLLSI